MAVPKERQAGDEIVCERTLVPGHEIQMEAIVARPRSAQPHPAMMVVHGNSGIDKSDVAAGPHYEDLCRRFSQQGYVAIAPNLFQRGGGSDAASVGQVNADLGALFSWLKEQPFVRPNAIGCVGFCWGGGASINAAIFNPDLDACVIYYGRRPNPIDDVQHITCPVIAFYGEADVRTTASGMEVRDAMARHGKSFEYMIYPEAQHVFFNDRNPDRYQAAAAADSWGRMLAFLAKHLQ